MSQVSSHTNSQKQEQRQVTMAGRANPGGSRHGGAAKKSNSALSLAQAWRVLKDVSLMYLNRDESDAQAGF
jgi:hypothetical protein